jgi:hypothetical protein
VEVNTHQNYKACGLRIGGAGIAHQQNISMEANPGTDTKIRFKVSLVPYLYL